ncbi:MAG: NUDIX domain-containing protein [Verrucomicrobiota bacterium]|nr:NUDIX domain-containing protein [Limisphaera sp.]MDW8381006.1 NUDIX domain-containing protein [Verrucomicrobiota bacterium]
MKVAWRASPCLKEKNTPVILVAVGSVVAEGCVRTVTAITLRTVIQNVILDWSGTLVDDLSAVWHATNQVLRRAGRPPMSLETFRSEFCLPFARFYDRHVPGVPLRQLEAWFHEAFAEVQHPVEALPHARGFLEFCQRHGLRTFVLSTVKREYFERQSVQTGLAPLLGPAYLEAWDKREWIGRLLSEQDLNPPETIFVGDMQHDVETAQHGGIGSCAVLTGYNTLDQLRMAGPDLIVEHLGELQYWLESEHWSWPPAVEKSKNQSPVVTVGALILNDRNEVLLVRTAKWSHRWGIPGGKVRTGEPSEAALRRELHEETGLEVTDVQLVEVRDWINPPEFYRPVHFVLFTYLCRVRGAPDVRINHESCAWRWVPLADALSVELNEPTRRLVERVLGSASARLPTAPAES